MSASLSEYRNRFALLGDADSPKPKPQPKKVAIPQAVLRQNHLRDIHKYTYKVINNGNIENNSTLYVGTGVGHAYQIEGIFNEAIERAKGMPEIFGKNFDCDVKVNVIRKHTGEYLAYAFVDVSNPKFYYALIGCNVDGSERVEYIDDPNWTPPIPVKKEEKEEKGEVLNWADEGDDFVPAPPKIRKELPPLITLKSYEYDEQQKEHFGGKETHGSVTLSPAFVSPGTNSDYDDCSLYVSDIPAMDYEFLYEIFARYARSGSIGKKYYPQITIKKSFKDDKEMLFAIVQYAHPYDASYALHMLQKIRARYNGQDISMPVRHAFSNRKKK